MGFSRFASVSQHRIISRSFIRSANRPASLLILVGYHSWNRTGWKYSLCNGLTKIRIPPLSLSKAMCTNALTIFFLIYFSSSCCCSNPVLCWNSGLLKYIDSIHDLHLHKHDQQVRSEHNFSITSILSFVIVAAKGVGRRGLRGAEDPPIFFQLPHRNFEPSSKNL